MDVGQNHQPVGVQLVQCIGGLGERGVRVEQRESGEVTEAIGPVLDDFGGVFVHTPGAVAGCGGVVPGCDRGGKRQ